MPPDQISIGLFATFIQAIGTLLIACMLYPLTRAMSAPFLRYWSNGWAILAVGLLALIVHFQIQQRIPKWERLQLVLLLIYTQSGCWFGFMLWRGCRAVASDTPLPRQDWLVLLMPMILACSGPLILQRASWVFPFHAMILTLFSGLSILALRQSLRSWNFSVMGSGMMFVMLTALGLVFGFYSGLTSYFSYYLHKPLPPVFEYSTFVDAFLQTGLAFGMIVLSADKMRETLESKTRELAEAARTDRLTGLLNRRAFEELVQSAEAPESGCLAMLDLNDLKPLNDRHGHASGDIALQLVARALRVHFRVTDPLFRMGGDEFLVLISGWSEAQLAERMLALDQSLLNMRIPNIPESVDLVTAWGVASFSNPEGIRDALEKADASMYLRKRAMKSQRAAG